MGIGSRRLPGGGVLPYPPRHPAVPRRPRCGVHGPQGSRVRLPLGGHGLRLCVVRLRTLPGGL
eukprot:5891196-Prymnesium_polylepis.1